MDALILAAGYGKRLMPLTKNKPKAMVKVADVPILERALDKLRRCNIKRTVIITGYQEKKIKNYFGSEWNGMELVYRKSSWFGDGILKSIIKAKGLFKGKFLFLCGDLIPTTQTLKDMIKTRGDIVISVTTLNPRDSVVAKVNRKTVKKIGMFGELTDCNKAVAPLGIYNPKFFDAVSWCIKNKKTHRPDAINWMMKKGYKVKAFNLEKDSLIEIDTLKDLKFAEKIIFQRSIDSRFKEEDRTIILDYLNLPITKPVTRLFAKTKLSPNSISIIGLFSFILASILFYNQHFIIGGLLAMFGRILDSVDGKISRLKLMKSKLGNFLEKTTDTLGDVIIVIGLALGLQQFYKDNLILIFGLSTILALFTAGHISRCLSSNYGKTPKIKYLRNVWDRYLIYFVLMITCIIGIPLAGLAYFAIAFVSFLLAKIFQSAIVIFNYGKNEEGQS